MIVSPHVKFAGTQEASPEVSGPQSTFKSKTNRKGTSGLFAKLLAGLTKNLSSRKAEGSGFYADPEKAGDTMFFNGVTAAPAGEKSALLFHRGRAAEGEISTSVFPAALRPGAAVRGASPARGTEKTAPRAENTLAGRFSGKQPVEGNRQPRERLAERPDSVPVGADFPSVTEGLFGTETGPGSMETPNVEDRKFGDPESAMSGHGVSDMPETVAGEWPVPGRDFGPPVSSAPPGPGEKGRNAGAGTRTGERRKEKPHLEVRDFRTGRGQEEGAGKVPGALEGEMTPRQAAAEGEELVVELRGGGRDMFSAENSREVRGSRSAQSFESLLARELNQSLSGDIVRHAQTVLRDGNAGTIRLTLRPETLGNVKIRLEMAENKITGHIIVESEEALRAFEREIHSLEQAFRNAGFEAADLEMSLSQGGESERRREKEEAGSLVSAGLAASRYAREQEVTTVEDRGLYVSGGQVTVNMLI